MTTAALYFSFFFSSKSISFSFSNAESDSNGCSDFCLRLRGGLNELSGLLEICYKGHWGTVCNDGSFNTSVVNVVCGQLGHASDGGSVLSETVYGQETGVIWLSQVECEDRETSIDMQSP